MLCYGEHFPVSISREIQFRTSRRHGYSRELKSGHRQLCSLLSVEKTWPLRENKPHIRRAGLRVSIMVLLAFSWC